MVSSGVDPSRIVIAGDSSGAGPRHGAAAEAEGATAGRCPGGAVWFCPWVDVTGSTLRIASRTNELAETMAGLVLPLVDDYLAGHPIDDPLLNPLQAGPLGPAADADPGSDGRPAARGRASAHRARPRPRRRGDARALPRRDAFVPDLLVVPARRRARRSSRPGCSSARSPPGAATLRPVSDDDLKIPKGRVRRSAKLGTALGGQAARYAGTRAAAVARLATRPRRSSRRATSRRR